MPGRRAVAGEQTTVAGAGLSHANMRIGVRVVSGADFDAWIEKTRTAQASTGDGGPGQTIVAKSLLFDTKEIVLDAGQPAAFLLDNQDAGVSHNFAVYANERAARRGTAPLFASRLVTGPAQERFEFTIDKAGTYFFRCDVHPDTMTGDLIAR